MKLHWHGLILPLLAWAALSAAAADKYTVRIGAHTITAWRTADLDAAKSQAAAQHKPIAWIASDPRYLNEPGTISANGSSGATLHALYALRDRTVLVFEDGIAENHRVLPMVDDAVHSSHGQPEHHPILPGVVFLNPDATEVLAKVDFEPDFVTRAQALAAALTQAEARLKPAPAAPKP